MAVNHGRGFTLDREASVKDILAGYASYALNRAAMKRLRDPGRISYAIDKLLPFWGNMTVHDISKNSFAQYVAWRMRDGQTDADGNVTEGVTIGTADRELSVLRTAVLHAQDTQKLHYAPRMRLHGKSGARADNYYSRKEIAALLRSARKNCRMTAHLVCLFILIAIYTGQRSEAILELRWTIGEDGGWIDMKRGVANFLADGATQSKKRRAHLVIPPRLLRFLKYAYAKRTSDYVFEFRDQRISCNKDAFGTALANAGFAARGRFRHTLRDTCITWLLDAGVSAWHISNFIDLSVEMILKTYGKKTMGGSERATMRQKLQVDKWINEISVY
ncbi:MAG: hypothetical protein JNM81_06985 [Rhodospirillaceae bacterium]|nr:hypothetical protein [Rhodospirillaceae bacterium]